MLQASSLVRENQRHSTRTTEFMWFIDNTDVMYLVVLVAVHGLISGTDTEKMVVHMNHDVRGNLCHRSSETEL